MKSTSNICRDTVFAALKLIEQLYIDGQISRTELIEIVRQNTYDFEFEEFLANLQNRKTA